MLERGRLARPPLQLGVSYLRDGLHQVLGRAIPVGVTARWALRWLVLVLVLLVTPPLAVVLPLWGHSWGTADEQARSSGQDAVWLGHAWVDGRRDQEDVAALAGRLHRGGVRDLFVHLGPVDDQGVLNPALHPTARWAVTSLRAALPEVRVQAWLGQRVDPHRLDLGDAPTRQRTVESARQALDLGFDGVHYNFEPVATGHRGLLELLDATRALTRSRNALLSLSAHHVEPLPGLNHLDDAVIGHTKWWSPEYLSQVAGRVDQLAVMSYDTALPTAALYSGYVRRQTSVALDAVPADTALLMGVPAYHDTTVTHRPDAETLAAAVRGVRLAIGAGLEREFGVAVYAEFSSVESDWRDYHTEWVRGQPG